MTPAKVTLREEIEDLLIARIDLGLVTNTTALAEEIMSVHHYQHLRSLQGLDPEDLEFYEECAWHHVKVTIRLVLRDYKLVRAQNREQMVLPGFEYVQKAYAIEQADEPKVVPIDKMTKEELIAKVNELRQMAEGCMKHADELERYRLGKFGK